MFVELKCGAASAPQVIVAACLDAFGAADLNCEDEMPHVADIRG